MLLYTFIISALLIVNSNADTCGLSLYGDSYVGLSEGAFIFSTNSESSQHTFDFWFNPQGRQLHDQRILQTGIVKTAKDTLWSIEFTFKATIWQHGQASPTSSILYIDIWTYNPEISGLWQKSRYYSVLGGESFPWLHVSFSSGGSSVILNGKYKRLDKQTPTFVDDEPEAEFALGKGFYGSFDEVRIWNSVGESRPDVHSSLCLDEIQSKLELYLPFNECRGSTFMGHTNKGSVCALLYGTDGQPLISPDAEATPTWDFDDSSNTPSPLKPIWISASPVVAKECTPREGVRVCSGSRHRAPTVSRKQSNVAAPTGTSDKSSYHPIANSFVSVFGFSGAIVIVMLVAAVGGMLVVTVIKRNNSKEDTTTRPRSKSIHNV